jgi:uncharacterized delta-60 repeat protein
MKGLLLIPMLTLNLYGQDSELQVEWENTYPFTENSGYSLSNFQFDDFSNTVHDKDGNIYLVTNNSFPAPNYKKFRLTKYSATGIRLWSVDHTDSVYPNNEAGAIAVDEAGNIHIAAYACSYYFYGGKADLIYLKYSPQGQLLWKKRYGNTNPYPYTFIVPQSIQFDFSNNAIISGMVGQFSAGDPEQYYEDSALIVKYDPEGELLWAAESKPDTVFIYQKAGVQLDDSGNVYVACTHYWYTPGKGHYDYMLIKYDSNGRYKWHAIFDYSDNTEDPYDLAIDRRGNSYVTGYYSYPYNNTTNYSWLTIRVDKQGRRNKSLIKEFEYGNSFEYGGLVETDQNDNVFIAGLRYDLGVYYFALEKYDSSCAFLWEKRFDLNFNGASKLLISQNNSIIIEGTDDSLDLHVLNLDQSGEINWEKKYEGYPRNYYAPINLANYPPSNLLITSVDPGDISNLDMTLLNNSGETVWKVAAKQKGKYSLKKITTDPNGNVYAFGQVDNGNADSDFAVIKYNSSGVALWGNRYQGPARGAEIPGDMVLDNSDNLYITGASMGNGSGSDFATLKYDLNGREQWRARYNGPAFLTDEAEKIKVDAAGNVIVAGNSLNNDGNYDMVTVKYSASGLFQWAKRYAGDAGGFDGVCGLEIDGSGNIYVGGTSDSLGALYDYFLIKYDPSGELMWTKRYNGPGNDGDMAQAMIMDRDENLYIAGWSVGDGTQVDFAAIKYTTSGKREWAARWDDPAGSSEEANDIAVDGDGNVFVAGYSPGAGTDNDFTVVKYNMAGEQQWFITFDGGENESDKADRIALDDHGDIYLAGTINNEKELAIVKYNSEGIKQWAESYQYFDYLHNTSKLIVDSAGHIYLGGTSNGINEGYWNVIKYKQADYIPTGSDRNLPYESEHILMQNFPNPFKSTTAIIYTIPASGLVTLRVYNALGIPIKTLVNEYKSPGEYRIDFSGDNEPGGLYIIQLNMENQKLETKKIMMIR